ncbi:EAL domain-containing protein [Rhizobium sp.]|jgi:diguanylate cyclase (GGDEF)-like protein|uniref:putative bifunctional diguanylate cyclase/phosphodiesterase n=1 Tax=Rhizobium sp. TaxID=391 RepID=UPI002AA90F9F
MFESIIQSYRTWMSPPRQQAMADAYRPIVRGFLAPGAAYYLFVTWAHWRDETGSNLVILGGISFLTAFSYLVFHRYTLPVDKTSLRRLEIVGILTNLLMYSNVLAYMLLHFEEQKLVYFALMAVVFSTSGVTLRGTLFSVILSIATLFWFASGASREIFQQFMFIGVATSFASFGMATLLRKAILRQIDARLYADKISMQDSLTGIANRRSLFGRMDVLVRDQQPFWIGILDLDGFKSINDIYGHAVGDGLLCDVVMRLEQFASDEIEFGRIGGDEFAILVTGPLDAVDVEQLGTTLIAAISVAYEISLLQLNVSGTIGFAHFPTMGQTSRAIYERADFALYRGKQYARRSTIIFNGIQEEEMKKAITLERGLREADLSRELYLVFQPQMDVIAHKIVSFEALARWESPTLGAISPERFIRAAERAGLIQRVTESLFSKGLDALETWPEDISISFNLSAQDVADRAFIFSLTSQVFARGIRPDRIEFEITETAVMKDIAASRSLLEDLSSAGFKVALDDFGSGYSSFAYIDQLPLDKVKIDKSFVRQVRHSAASREIVASIITLCHNLNLKCVLEGVETEDEMATLTPMTPQIIQGYLFGKPMPGEDVAGALAQNRKTAGIAKFA